MPRLLAFLLILPFFLTCQQKTAEERLAEEVDESIRSTLRPQSTYEIPDSNSTPAARGGLVRPGQELQVLRDSAGWIAFQFSPQARDTYWIQKHLTEPYRIYELRREAFFQPRYQLDLRLEDPSVARWADFIPTMVLVEPPYTHFQVRSFVIDMNGFGQRYRRHFTCNMERDADGNWSPPKCEIE